MKTHTRQVPSRFTVRAVSGWPSAVMAKPPSKLVTPPLVLKVPAILGIGNTLAMEVSGLAAGIGYDVLDVNGVLTLAGLLDVDFINLFENSVQFSDIFTIATADSPILGAFSNVSSGSRIDTNAFASFEVWYGAGSPYGANNLVLTGAPEPSRVLLFVLSITGR